MWMLLVLLLAANAVACEKGCYPYKDTCACDVQPEIAPAVKPDNAKPPRSGMPSWQAEGVHVIAAPDLREQDEKQDADRAAAEAQGKKAAGIK